MFPLPSGDCFGSSCFLYLQVIASGDRVFFIFKVIVPGDCVSFIFR